MSQKTLDLIGWVKYLERSAHGMILDDNLLKKAPPLFRKCEALATKKDGLHYDCDKGAFTLMATLFSDCLCHQFNLVELLFLEYFPPMSPRWNLHKPLWTYRFLMYQRFQLGDGKIKQLCDQLESRIQSGKILTVQSRVYEEWLRAED
ncbi:MAG: hypothetical protein KKB30_17135 [Proteobacteria bacterium]|nr:hypothetical protein [Pseudomonadota bacterium]MBU1739886.1 hypothetical protein [Pseudomonadota bacterium]MBU1858216.1 hypothetical protein [Verrucomicrobiota bacterium]